MPEYTFKARNNRGKVLRGTLWAETEAEAGHQLTSKKYEVLSLKLRTGWGASMDAWLARIRPPSAMELAVTTRQLATMLEAGIGLVRALQVITQQPLSARLGSVWGQVALDVQRGQYLSRGLGKHPDVFDSLYQGMAKAGEASGGLNANLAYVANHLEKDILLRSRIRAALTYPCMVFVISSMLAVIIVQHILPQFLNGLFKDSGVALPWITQSLIILTNFFNDPRAMGTAIAFLVIGGYSLFTYLRTPAGRFRWQRIELMLPVVKGIVLKFATARFCRIMATLVRSGIPIIHCLDLTDHVLGNYVLSERLQIVKEHIKDGGKLSEGLVEAGIFPTMLCGFVKLGEDTGHLPLLLDRLADLYEQELEVALETATNLIEPLVTAVMGMFVAYVLIAVFIPLYKIIANF